MIYYHPHTSTQHIQCQQFWNYGKIYISKKKNKQKQNREPSCFCTQLLDLHLSVLTSGIKVWFRNLHAEEITRMSAAIKEATSAALQTLWSVNDKVATNMNSEVGL